MAKRIVEVIIPENIKEEAIDVLEEAGKGEIWEENILKGNYRVKVLLPTEETGPLLDELNRRFSGIEQFRVVMYSVEASLPRKSEVEKEEEEAADRETPSVTEEEEVEEEEKPPPKRISREELYEDITESIDTSFVFLTLVFLSSIVASFGLLRSDVAIIVGAMVIAPIIGPNMALALGTTLGDMELTVDSLKANVLGILTAFVTALVLGFLIKVSPDYPEIASRTRIGFGDVALAMASGAAGALSFTVGLSTTLIGVMVSVALLPPIVASGMLLVSGFALESGQAFLLVMNNVICINLTAVITFLVQGIQPMKWWEAQKAKKMTTIAVSIWVGLLIILLFIILLMKNPFSLF